MVKTILKYISLMAGLCILTFSCGQSSKKAANERGNDVRKFPHTEIPSIVDSDPSLRISYLAEHWWDKFFSGSGRTDSAFVMGVSKAEVEQNMSAYLGALHLLPVDKAQKYVTEFFSDMENGCLRDSLHTKAAYEQMTDIACRYFYDPNSPLRSEDLYLPFVKGLVSSPLTSPEKISGYRFELEKCMMNPYGAVVPDFTFKDATGRSYRLHQIKAQYTILFFSNPGCQSCKDIIDQIGSRNYIDALIDGGHLAIVNVYIDMALDQWREYEPNYPRNWYNGYDPDGTINEGELYYVRAIPSLYLLDAQKRVIMKDAPVERVLEFFDNMINSTQYD